MLYMNLEWIHEEVAAGGQGPLFFTAHLVFQTVVLNENPLYEYVGSCKFAQQCSDKLFLEDILVGAYQT